MTLSDKKRTYFITGGGTGGHIYPAIAIADELVERGNDVFYVGNPSNLEFEITSGKPYKFLPVNVHGMPRKASLALIKWMFELGLAVIKSIGYIKKHKPDVIFGTGGYVSAPALMAGKIVGIPYMLHDCDANPGLVTRKLAPWAKCVSLAFEGAKSKIKNDNCLICGNPIRKTFKTLTKQEARTALSLEDKITICVMGGSQGARSINSGVVEILKKLSKDFGGQVIFQSGKKNFQRVIEQLIKVYPEYSEDKNLLVKPYFDDMVTVLKASDIAISRAGSLSLSELCASGIASILVPYPFAAADHQRKNAKYMQEKNASLYIEDDDVNGDALMTLLTPLLNEVETLKTLQNNALLLAKYDAVSEIADKLSTL
ncbi:undecaprenyldiphospho-muramoylpentapeptide beta-N-acetylglucosaminyltransferase [bacterium]|nr:undecaprenyldiphospho-muramoylpentapeptide beta-N-acetylglucosaminyltransferase [bacterium]